MKIFKKQAKTKKEKQELIYFSAVSRSKIKSELTKIDMFILH